MKKNIKKKLALKTKVIAEQNLGLINGGLMSTVIIIHTDRCDLTNTKLCG